MNEEKAREIIGEHLNSDNTVSGKGWQAIWDDSGIALYQVQIGVIYGIGSTIYS